MAVRDGRLVVTDIEVDNAGPRNPYAPPPWDTTELVVVSTPHAMVAVTADARHRIDDLADAAEVAYQQARPFWPADAPARFAVFGTGRPDVFASWYGAEGALGAGTAGQAIPVATCCATARDTLGDITSTHVVVDLDEVATGPELERLLAHELTHAVAQPRATLGNRLPRWADEGYAEFVAIQPRRAVHTGLQWDEVVRAHVDRGRFSGELPTDADFYAADSRANYGLAVRFFDYLARRYGTAQVTDFYFGLTAMPALDVDAAMRRSFGASETEIVSAWAAWLIG